MENAEWTLIFLVPAEYVATNTLKLVNFVMVFIVIFTVIVAVCVMLGISFVMRRNQQEAIRVERENNAKLETVNTKLRQAKQAAEALKKENKLEEAHRVKVQTEQLREQMEEFGVMANLDSYMKYFCPQLVSFLS